MQYLIKLLDKTTIEQALNQLQSASEALHGEQKLQESKIKLIVKLID